jgi:hypothetical protein
MKKPWQQPKLIVLVRGRPEELILTFCKMPSETYPVGAGDAAPGCFYTGLCEACFQISDGS